MNPKPCPICDQGHLRRTRSRSSGHPDAPGFEAYDIYTCDQCGYEEERDVS